MRSISRIWQKAAKPFRSNPLAALALVIAATWAVYFLILVYGKSLAEPIPLLAVGLGWVWFLLPGFLFSFFSSREFSWWERIPVAFVLSIGIATPITVASILLHLSLDTFILLHAASLLVSTLMSLFGSHPNEAGNTPPPLEVGSSSSGIPFKLLFILLVVMVGVIAGLSLGWPITGDDTAILPLFSDVLSQNRITGVEPFHGSGVPVTPRNELIVATYVEILTNKVAGVTPQEFIINTRPFLVILAVLSLATLLNQFQKNKRLNLFLLCLWSIYLLANLQSDKTGSDFISRIFQDKFLGWFIIVPVALVFMLQFIETRNWDKLTAFTIVTLGASMVHPITLTQVMILAGGFGIVHFALNRSKAVFTNLAIIAGMLLFCTFIPFMQYLRYTNYMPVDLVGLGDAVEFGRLSAAVGRYRLWLLDGGSFILHPSVILTTITIAGYALLPVIAIKKRQDYLAQLLVGGMILLPILLYIPIFARLVGKVVTPYLIWRLAWPLPLFAILVIGWVLWDLAVQFDGSVFLKRVPVPMKGWVYPGLIALVLLVSVPNIRGGVKDYNERRAEVKRSSCYLAADVFLHLADLTKDVPANVLSTHDLNLCIPGYAPNANVLEFRGYGTINRLSYDNIEESIQRVEDAYYFNSTNLVDDLLMTSINQHKIDYILMEKDRLELDFQFSFLPTHFERAYEDENYRLYLVKNRKDSSRIVEANSALRKKQYAAAKEEFSRILQNEPKNVLAHLGIGLAEEGLGNSGQAIKSYLKAIAVAPEEPALHAQLASAYMLMRDFEDSAREYQAAIYLSPNRSDLYKALGEIDVLLGRYDAALSNFERYASLRAIEGSASYYSFLGRTLQNIDFMTDQAFAYQEKALSIQPDSRRYIDLARSLILAERTDEAIEVLDKAMKQDRWNYLPHLELGYIYWSQGDIDKTIDAFETACRLNPANVSAYILLGKAIQEKYGTDAAITRMEELKRINDVLPGPIRSSALLQASAGDYQGAMAAIERSSAIQPKSAAVLTSKGYISMIAGQMDTAFEAFADALLSYPDLISAKLGLGMLYDYEANYQLETGQFHQIVQLVPMESWIHLTLADMYKNLGNYSSALDEVNWAIKLDSDNPEVYTSRGNIYRMQSNWSLAISDYTIARDLDPNNFDVLIGLGEIYQSQGKYVEAEMYYKLASDRHPESVYPVIHLADLYLLMGRIDEAGELEDTARTMAPDSSPVMIKIANSYEKQGKIDEAREIYNQVIQTNPSAISAYVGLAQLASEADNDPKMLFSVYKNMLGTNPHSAEAYLASGQFFIEQAQFTLAEQILTAALSFSDVSIDNYLALSELQQRLGKADAARQTLETATTIFPGNAAGFNSLGYFHLKRGDLPSVGVNFDKAIALNPGLIEAYKGKSQIEQIMGEPARAEVLYKTAVEKNPGSVEAFLALAEFQEFINQIDEAEETVHDALEINPGNIGAHEFAASFYMRRKNYAAAADHLETALNLPGPKVVTYLQLGDLETAQENVDKAIEWYLTANLEDKSDARPYLALAKAYQSAGKFDKALNSLVAAHQFEPANVEINIALGELHARLGNKVAARVFLEKAVSYDQSDANALIALAKLDEGQGKWVEAITLLSRAAAAAPASFTAHDALAQAYQLTGNCTQAETSILTGIQNTFDKQAATLAAAGLFERCRNWERAMEYYELAWSREPNSLTAGLAYANYLHRRNENERSLAALTILESRVGRSPKIYNTIGKVYASQANWAKAEEAYQQAIALDAGDPEGYLGLANIDEAQGNFDAAIDLYTAAVDKVTDPVDIHLKTGAIFRRRGDLDGAYAAFQKAVALDAFNITGILTLQELEVILNKPGVELAGYARDALNNPITPAFTTVGQVYQVQGKWTPAYSWFEKAVYLEPLNSDSWYYLGSYYQSAGQLEKALESYTQAVNLNPGSAQCLVALGQVQEEMGLYDAAKESYLLAIVTQPGDITAYVALAMRLLAEGSHENALKTIHDGILQAPADYQGYVALGDLLLAIDAGNFEQAEKAYQDGLAVLPANPDLHVKIGMLHQDRVIIAWERFESAKEYESWTLSQYQVLMSQLGPDEDIESVRRSIRKNIEDALQTYELAHMEYQAASVYFEQTSENYAQAMISYQNALEIDVTNAQALMGLGKLQLTRGLTAEALQSFETACDMNPLSTLAWINLGNYYAEIGQAEKAVSILEIVSAREPGNSLTQTALANIYSSMDTLSISQAAKSVQQSPSKLSSIIEDLRQKERRY